MTKVEFLAMSLPSGLKVFRNGKINTLISLSILSPKINTPIIRPMSALTEPCVQSDYNGGKPFEPHDELMKISVCDAEIKFVYTLLSNTHDRNRLLRFAPLTFVNLLIKWHFWPNMPEGESVVYVDDNFNPYK